MNPGTVPKGVMVVLACGWAVLATGCASLNKYNSLKAANLALQGRAQSLEDELYDARNSNESLRNRVSSVDDQLASKNALVSNLQAENDRLAETARITQETLEDMAERYRPTDIAISGPKLPHELDSALQAFADAHPGAVAYDAAHGTIKWKGDLLFAFASDVVVESAKPSLEGFTTVMKSAAAEGFEAIVVGHTDNVPIGQEGTLQRHPTNWHLSVHRAISVCDVLVKSGLSSERIAVMGCGEFRPVAGNETDQGRGLNRRVEIYLVPRGSIVSASAGKG